MDFCANSVVIKANVLAHLKEKREWLIKEFVAIKTQLSKGMVENSYSTDMIMKMEILFPQNVNKAFEEMMADKSKNDDKVKLKIHYAFILREMHKAIADIDKRIDEEIAR